MADPFFSYDHDFGARWGITFADAERQARKALDDDSDHARDSGEWTGVTDQIRMGVVLAQVVPTDPEWRIPDGETVDAGLPVVLVEDLGRDPTVRYTLEPVPGAVEAVLGLATVEQLQAELRRRWVAAAVHG